MTASENTSTTLGEFTSVNPFLEGDTIHNEDGTVTSRSMFFWEKQVMRLLYHWTKAGNCLNPNVRITLEDPSERPN